MEGTPNTLALLENLRGNSHLGKHKHFAAADRNKLYHVYYGVPVVIINVLLGSLLFANLSQEVSEPMKWVGAFMSLLAAGLSGTQTFFNFQKTFEAHRKIGNQYLVVARECERLIALFKDDLLELPELAAAIERINGEYNRVNFEAEDFPTNKADYRKALAIQASKDQEEGIEPAIGEISAW